VAIVLFLVIIPSAFGIYFLIKPPTEEEAEIENAAPDRVRFEGIEESPVAVPSMGPVSILREQA